LWGSYIIRSPRVSIYFSGDSGYGRHYRETGEVFPDIDYFLIGIGAYEPRWFMEPNHNSPAEAVTAFEDAGARTLIPMHFGRFDMSDEPPSWPLRDLKQAAQEKGVWQNVRPLSINEHILFER
jgi:L-ascorbate metabolism protein UlaG (beta-lactamase superfamily)